MLPQFIVMDAFEGRERISVVVTQPRPQARRMAALSLAQRISQQLGGNLGSKVWYKIGYRNHSAAPKNIINTVATAGYFLKHLSKQDDLNRAQRLQTSRVPLEIHVLHSLMPRENQEAAINPAIKGYCKVILSTNIGKHHHFS